MAINKEFLLANHADLVEAFRAEGRSAGLETGRQEGAAAERTRIQGVYAQAMPGHAALVQKLAFDGKTTGPEAAAQILAAERTKLGKKAEDLIADAGALASTGPTPAADPGAAAAASAEAAAELEKKPLEERCKAKWDADASLRASYADDFKAYVAFERAQASGRVRILGAKRAG